MGGLIPYIGETVKECPELLIVGLIAILALTFIWIQEQRIKARDERFKDYERIVELAGTIPQETKSATEEAGLPQTIVAGEARVELTDEQEKRFAALEEKFREFEAERMHQGLNLDADTHRRRALQLYHRGHEEEAIATLRRTTDLAPDDDRAYSNLGASLVNKGDYAAAITACNKAIELNPGDPYPYNNLGVALFRKGDYESAIAAFNKGVELRPDAIRYSNLAEALAAADKDLDEALEHAENGCQLSKGDWHHLDTLGFVHIKRGDYEAALYTLEEARAKQRENAKVADQDHYSVADLAYHYAMALEGVGRKQEAAEHYRRALALEPDADWTDEARRGLEETERQEGEE